MTALAPTELEQTVTGAPNLFEYKGKGVLEKPLTPRKLLPLIQLHRPTVVAEVAPRLAEFTRAELEQGLREDEFEPYFQPKIHLATGKVKVCPPNSTVSAPCSATNWAGTIFISGEPMKLATKALAGWSYSAVGVSTC